jgi:hypothetical protein
MAAARTRGAAASGAPDDGAPGGGADGWDDACAGLSGSDAEAAESPPSDADQPAMAPGGGAGGTRFTRALTEALRARLEASGDMLRKPPSEALCAQWADELRQLVPHGAAGDALRAACTAARVLPAVNRLRAEAGLTTKKRAAAAQGGASAAKKAKLAAPGAAAPTEAAHAEREQQAASKAASRAQRAAADEAKKVAREAAARAEAAARTSWAALTPRVTLYADASTPAVPACAAEAAEASTLFSELQALYAQAAAVETQGAYMLSCDIYAAMRHMADKHADASWASAWSATAHTVDPSTRVQRPPAAKAGPRAPRAAAPEVRKEALRQSRVAAAAAVREGGFAVLKARVAGEGVLCRERAAAATAELLSSLGAADGAAADEGGDGGGAGGAGDGGAGDGAAGAAPAPSAAPATLVGGSSLFVYASPATGELTFGGANFPLCEHPAFQRLMRGLMGAPEPRADVHHVAQRRAERRAGAAQEADADAAVAAADALGAEQAAAAAAALAGCGGRTGGAAAAELRGATQTTQS